MATKKKIVKKKITKKKSPTKKKTTRRKAPVKMKVIKGKRPVSKKPKIDQTLAIPAVPAIITIAAGWVEVVGAIISLVLAIFNK